MPGEEDIVFMRMALEEAVNAFDRGEVPVGAHVVRSGSIISKAHNLSETTKDPSAHADILALRAATGISDSWQLLDATAKSNSTSTKKPTRAPGAASSGGPENCSTRCR